MLRNKDCSNCVNCSRDVQVNMKCYMDLCLAAFNFLGPNDGFMNRDYEAKYVNEMIITKDCPCYVPRQESVDPKLKEDFTNYYNNVVKATEYFERINDAIKNEELKDKLGLHK